MKCAGHETFAAYDRYVDINKDSMTLLWRQVPIPNEKSTNANTTPIAGTTTVNAPNEG